MPSDDPVPVSLNNVYYLYVGEALPFGHWNGDHLIIHEGMRCDQPLSLISDRPIKITLEVRASLTLIDGCIQSYYYLQSNAHLVHCNPQGRVQAQAAFRLDASARLSHFHMRPLQHSVNSNVQVTLAGVGSSVDWREGIHLTNEEARNLQITIDHQAPETHSNCLVKSVLEGKGSLSFLCDVFLQKKAQRAIAHQRNLNCILSPQGLVKTCPRLHVFNKQVEASHGTATQPVDKEVLFYLQSRGYTKEQAYQLFLESFLAETELIYGSD